MKRTVEVRHVVEVEIDESKFTPDFMREFRENFYDFASLNEHFEHLAQLYARGLDRDFIEGYGPVEEMGISMRTVDIDAESAR
jgi:hypothetical protein